MSGLAFRRVPPAVIGIVPRRFDPDGADGVRKRSIVTMSPGPLGGGDLKLGLRLERAGNQHVESLVFTHLDLDAPAEAELLDEGQWANAYEALGRFRPPGPDHKWVIFAIDEMPDGFTSELVLRPKPRPGEFQEVAIIAFHVLSPEQEWREIVRNLRLGLYGYGISLVRRDGDWPEINGAPSTGR